MKSWGKHGRRSLPDEIAPGQHLRRNLFDSNVRDYLRTIQAYFLQFGASVQSPEFHQAVRRIDQKLNVTNATLVKVPFDLERWQTGRRREVPERPARAPQRRPDPMALQGPSERLDRPAPGRRGPAARLPLARSGAGRPRRSLADTDGIVPIPAVRAKTPPPSGCARSCGPPSARNGPRRWRTGCWSRPGQVGHVARRLAPQPVLRAALQAVPQPPVHLAHLGRSQGRLLVPGELPQARPQGAGEPDLLVPRRLDHRPDADVEGGKTGADLRLAAAQEFRRSSS